MLACSPSIAFFLSSCLSLVLLVLHGPVDENGLALPLPFVLFVRRERTGLSLVPCLRGFGGLNWTCQDSTGCARARVLVLSMPVFPIFIYFFALDCTLHCTDIERTLCARVPYPGPCSISILFRRSDHHIVFLATSHLRVFAVPPSPCIPFPSPRALPVLEESNIWQSLG
ncbi:hypothetical protein B0H13DRAFT_2046098 [Mycena leptocephala]|nr:hypothetical protein B0H13DRAFT_2046098 [Mycena leptocephala]